MEQAPSPAISCTICKNPAFPAVAVNDAPLRRARPYCVECARKRKTALAAAPVFSFLLALGMLAINLTETLRLGGLGYLLVVILISRGIYDLVAYGRVARQLEGASTAHAGPSHR